MKIEQYIETTYPYYGKNLVALGRYEAAAIYRYLPCFDDIFSLELDTLGEGEHILVAKNDTLPAIYHIFNGEIHRRIGDGPAFIYEDQAGLVEEFWVRGFYISN